MECKKWRSRGKKRERGGNTKQTVCYKWILQLIINSKNFNPNNTWRLIIYEIRTGNIIWLHTRHFVAVLHRALFFIWISHPMYRFFSRLAERTKGGNKLLNNNYYPSMRCICADYYLWMLFNKITSYRGDKCVDRAKMSGGLEEE